VYCGGKPICGDLWVSGNGASYDVDYYILDLSAFTAPARVSATVIAQMPVDTYILENTCTDPKILAEAHGVCTTVATACLAPGVYRILLAPGVSDGYPCSVPNRLYRLQVTCESTSQECCDTDSIQVDLNGFPVLPPNWDRDLPVITDVEYDRGAVSSLYPGMNTTLDTWYGQIPCDPIIGTDVDDEDEEDDLQGDLAAQGIVGDPAAMLTDIEGWGAQIAAVVAGQPDGLLGALPVVPFAFTPGGPHCPQPGNDYAFGGRDIVLIHGLRLEHIVDCFQGVPGADAKWQQPTVFPGLHENPQFYGSGYFKQKAEANWDDYIQNFLIGNNKKNRYLVVCYPCTQRAEVAVHAVLTQIADAMRTGEGVVDLSGCGDTRNFGTPSFVILSHSTGALITDASMHAAATYSTLQAAFIPQHCKAHVAPSGAFLGSDMATAAVTFADMIPYGAIWDVCQVAKIGLELLDPDVTFPNCSVAVGNFKDMVDQNVKNSVLVDLIPAVAQQRWGPAIAGTPVRTLTAVAGHPSQSGPAKRWLHRGIDDGVVTINSQIPSPTPVGMSPVSFFPDQGRRSVFDKGLKKGLNNPARARGYYKDQAKDSKLQDDAVASGATRWISPAGMLQPTAQYTTPQVDPHLRYPNHYTFTQSASSHKSAIRSLGQYPFYQHTGLFSVETNWEETRVITDSAVYQPYSVGSPGHIDFAPLLKTSTCMPDLREEVRGSRIKFKVKIFGLRFSYEKWIWKRVYHLLQGSRNAHQMDYLHYSVLCTPIDCSGPRCDVTPDFNADGLVDGGDLGVLLANWGKTGTATPGDLNGDAMVDGADLGILLAAWTGG
jgi:hypothetical protein